MMSSVQRIGLYLFLVGMIFGGLGSISPVHAATYTATRNGYWGDPTTWSRSRAPTNADAVVIPSGINVTLPGGLVTRNATTTIAGALFNSGFSGFFDNYSTITIQSGGSFYNVPHTTLTLRSGSTLTNAGTLSNLGTVHNDGTVNNIGTITNAGYFLNINVLTNDGILNNTTTTSQLINDDTLTNNGTINNGGTLGNTATLNNDGSIANTYTVDNQGMITNAAGATITNANGSTITNETSATILNASGATITNDGTLINNGAINNYSTIVNNNTTNNFGIINNYCGGAVTGNGVSGNAPVNYPLQATAPSLVSPIHRNHTTDTTPKFTWSSVAGAQSYRLMIYVEDRSFEYKKRVFVNNYTLTNAEALSPAKYLWRVRTQDPTCNTWTGWSSRNTLFID
jgi:hypothetical protein